VVFENTVGLFGLHVWRKGYRVLKRRWSHSYMAKYFLRNHLQDILCVLDVGFAHVGSVLVMSTENSMTCWLCSMYLILGCISSSCLFDSQLGWSSVQFRYAALNQEGGFLFQINVFSEGCSFTQFRVSSSYICTWSLGQQFLQYQSCFIAVHYKMNALGLRALFTSLNIKRIQVCHTKLCNSCTQRFVHTYIS
jgi:hypothetical protein